MPVVKSCVHVFVELSLALSSKRIIIAVNNPERWLDTMKRTNRDMLQGPLFSNIISYTIPIILTSVLQLLFNAADLVIVGRYRGSVSVAAVGATGAITNLIVNLFIGLSVGAGVSVGSSISASDES